MDGCRMHIEGSGDFADGATFLDQHDREGLLIRT
jgi:hypothetical protein